MKNNHSTLEQSYLRAGAVIIKARRNKDKELLLVSQIAKKETSAGLQQWYSHHWQGWLIPGGMRKFTDSGVLQTREQVIDSRLQKELGLSLSLAFLKQAEVQQYPFLMGRSFLDLITEVAATSVLFYLDELDGENQERIQQQVQKGKAKWFSLPELSAELQRVGKAQELDPNTAVKFIDQEIRPHAYTTAYIWYLSEMQQWSDEAILREINRLNATTKLFILHQRKSSRGLSKIFSHRGNITIPFLLSEEDKKFLYGM